VRENRKHARVEARLRCWCEAESVTFYARIDNISEGGLFLRTHTPLAKGTAAQLRIGQGADGIETEAQVMWSSAMGAEGPPGMGLRFEGLSGDTRARLRALVGVERVVSAGAPLELSP
jgi:uncharacterized protein (TIGR02266 family)